MWTGYVSSSASVLHQGTIDGLGFRNIQFQAPDRRRQAIAQPLQATAHGAAPVLVALAQQGRVEVQMHLPGLMRRAVVGRLMHAHRIGE